MDNFFELLPFIIGILYFVFGGRKKKKETSKPNHRKPKTTSNSPSLDDILKELTGETSRPKPPPIYTETPAAPSQMIWENARDDKEKLELELEEDVYVDQYEHRSSRGPSLEELHSEIMEDQHLEYVENNIEFDLRQAIINDAILNRPYQ